MTTFDTTARERSVAHVLDLMAIHTRNGIPLVEIADLTDHVARIATGAGQWPELHYRSALNLLRVSADDIDASVAAVLRGEHPADSLMGRVAKMRSKALNVHAAAAKRGDATLALQALGESHGLDRVLDLLEGEGRNATTARSI